MPYKNKLKNYVADTYYHLYARGTNKTEIFRSDSDYIFFLHILKKYLTPEYTEKKYINGVEVDIPVNSVASEVRLNAYCLMPNHFHLLVYNVEEFGIQRLMSRVLTTYVRVFNQKYSREGSLIQGSYRSVNVYGEPQLIHTSRYIHLNPLKSGIVTKSVDYHYSSLKYYLKRKSPKWLVLDDIVLSTTDFKTIDSYLSVLEKEDSPI